MKLDQIILCEMDARTVSLVDTVNSNVVPLYSMLNNALNFVYANADDPNKASKFRIGSMMSKWFSDNYLSTGQYVASRAGMGLKDMIRMLSEHPSLSLPLKTRLKKLADLPISGLKQKQEDERGSMLFKKLEQELPLLMVAAGEELKNVQLQRAGQIWMDRSKQFYSMWEKLRNEGTQDDETDQLKQPSVQDAKKAVMSQQMEQMEKVVNQILSTLKPSVAGEIRNAIAKTGSNKLQALKQELNKRGLAGLM